MNTLCGITSMQQKITEASCKKIEMFLIEFNNFEIFLCSFFEVVI